MSRNWLFALPVALCGYAALGETLNPTLTRYLFDKRPSGQTDECGMTLSVTNYPSPEYVNVRLTGLVGKGGNAWGLAVIVSELTSSAPTFKPIPIDTASFSGKDFSSEGRLRTTQMSDGSVFLVSPEDAATIGAMELAFISGNLSVSFRRQGSSTTRTYHVVDAAPPGVARQFTSCVEAMFKQ